MKALAPLVVLALVLGCHSASHCHWGPAYWCQSEATASECGGTKYCQDNVWKKSTPPVTMVSRPQGIIECEVCKIAVDFIQKELLQNKTEAQVKQALLQFCNSTGPLAGACVSFVNDEFDNLWNIIVNEGVADACSELKLCSSSKAAMKKEPRPLMKSHVKSSIECEMCTLVAKELINIVESNMTETEAKVEIKKVCVYLGGFAGICRTLIDTYFDELWDLAFNKIGDPTVICQKISLCPMKMALRARVKAPALDLCPICQLVVKFLKPFVDGNNSKDEVKDALETFCSLLPGNTSAECSKMIDSYFDLIWDIMKGEVDNGEACTMIKLCNSTSVAMVKAEPRPPLTDGPACQICELAAKFLQTYVDSNTTEQEAKAALQKACSLLPSAFAQECNDTVNQNFDNIWKLLQEEVDSGDICKLIDLCSGTERVVLKKDVVGGEVCDACKFVVSYLKEIVDSSTTESEAKAMVEEVCNEAGALKDECTSVVDQYFPMVWKLLQSYVDDDQICEEIKLCTSKNTIQMAVAKAQSPKAKGGVFCMVCELVIKELTSMLDGNSTQQAIEDALDKVCDALPSSFKDDCTHFVDKYAPEIIELILSGTAAKGICMALGLCLTSTQEVEEFATIQGAGECEVCKTVLELAKKLIASKSAEQKVDEVIENVCALVPSGIRSECKSFIETFGPQLIQLLDDAIDPQTICNELKVCSSVSLPMAMKY